MNWGLLVGCGVVLAGCGGKSSAGAASGSSSKGGSPTLVECDDGRERCSCYKGTCNDGLVCLSLLCVRPAPLSNGGSTSSSWSSTLGGAISSTNVGHGGGVVEPPPNGGSSAGGSSAGGSSAGGSSAGGSSAGGSSAGSALVTTGGRVAATGGGPSFGGASGFTAVGGRMQTAGSSFGAGGFVGIGGAINNGGATTAGSGPTCNMPPSIGACDGIALTVEPPPLDLVILVDRSIANSYAVGSDAATPAASGQVRRWDMITSALQAFASRADAQTVGASLTFLSVTGGSLENPNCDDKAYETPVVPLDSLSINGAQIVSAMQAIVPAGLTPLVPALTGAFRYAMAASQLDPTRQKALVLLSDGFATQCALKAPSDVVNVIQEAAGAPMPILTFVIGIGSPTYMTSAKFNLQNYAKVGATGKMPYIINEAAGPAAAEEQLVTALLDISHSAPSCTYALSPPVDPTRVRLSYVADGSHWPAIPRVPIASACSSSLVGGWYFDNPSSPTRITACPCTCSSFVAAQPVVVFDCGTSEM